MTQIKTIWKPQLKQMLFQERSEYEALYGGAAGGGKSDALLTEALRQIHIPKFRGLILRKTYPQLTELIDRSQYLYKQACPNASYSSQGHVWSFPSGAKIYFGNLQHPQDKINYQGKRFDFVGFDELTHFTWEEYSYLLSRNRPGTDLKSGKTRVYVRATANPGGIGHGWVKQRFIDPAPPMTAIKEVVPIDMGGGVIKNFIRDRVFVPSTVFDNPALLKENPNYLSSLGMLPTQEREALLYGSWTSFSGQVFTDFVNDPNHYQDKKWTHVIKPFIIPKHFPIIRGFDFGYKHPFSVGWYAVCDDGKIIRIAEYYGTNGTPNEGVRMSADKIAKEILRIEREDPNLIGRHITGIADPAITQKNGADSILDIMAKEGVYWSTGNNHRLAGKMQVHYRLAFDEFGVPGLQAFNTCRHFIRTIPQLVYDEMRVEDIDTTGEDHIYDELRYVLMTRPVPPKPVKTKRKNYITLTEDGIKDVYGI